MTFSLTGNKRMDGRTDSHSDYSADLRVVQFVPVESILDDPEMGTKVFAKVISR